MNDLNNNKEILLFQGIVEESIKNDLSKKINFDLISEEKQQELKINFLTHLLDEVIQKTTNNFSEEEKNEVLRLLEEQKIDQAINYIKERNKDYEELKDDAILKVKADLLQLLIS